MTPVYQVDQAPGAIHSWCGAGEGSPRLHELEALGEELAATIGGFGLVGDRVGKRHLYHFAGEVRLFRSPVPEARPEAVGRALVLAVAQGVAGDKEAVLGHDAAAVAVGEDELMILAQALACSRISKAAGGEGDDMVALHFHAPAGCRVIAGDRPGLSLPVHLIPPRLPRLGREL